MIALVVIAGLVLVAVRLLGGGGGGAQQPTPAKPPSNRPNIVFVLTDDLSMDLLQYMPHVAALEHEGMTFSNYFVSDSLCCPSRASIFTGDFPHNTKIVENLGAHGGFRLFHLRGEERQSFPVRLQRAGYVTAMMGKYLNGYLQTRAIPAGLPLSYEPPGFNEWDVAGLGYPEFNYTLNENGALHHYGHQPADYLTDVLAAKGTEFVDHTIHSGLPFFLELATFAPHTPYTPAPRDLGTFPGLRAPRPPNFDVLPSHAPHWLAGRAPLTPARMTQIDHAFRLRVESVQAVDRMIGSIEHAVANHNLTHNTYFVFSSDNGLHTGEYRLLPGKMTAFDTDIHVPLVIAGPGIRPGRVSSAMVQNVDLAKTFAGMAGTSMPSGDGHSLLGLLHGASTSGWRNAILVEHRGPNQNPLDPDFQSPASGNPTTYRAMRTRTFLYVEYGDGEREFYDLRNDPFELHNLAGSLGAAQLARLHHELARLGRCRGGVCWRAGNIPKATLP